MNANYLELLRSSVFWDFEADVLAATANNQYSSLYIKLLITFGI